MPAPGTLWRAIQEGPVAVFALPADAGSRFSPYASGPLPLHLHFHLAVVLGISRVAVGPFVELGRLSWAFCAPDVAATLAYGGRGRDEQSLALVAGTTHTLLGRLVGQLLAVLGGDGEDTLLLGQCVGLLCLGLFGRALLLGVAGALLAALVLALGTDLVGAVGGSAAVAGAVDTHADRLLDALDVHRQDRGSNPFVGLEGEAILCKQRAGTLLLHGRTLQGSDDGGGDIGVCVVELDGDNMVGRVGRGRSLGCFLLFDGLGGEGRRGSGRGGGAGLVLCGFIPLEDAAHALHVLSQALTGIPVCGVLDIGRRGGGLGGHGVEW